MPDLVRGFNGNMRLEPPLGNLVGHDRELADRLGEPARQPVCRQDAHQDRHQFNADKQPAQNVDRLVGLRLVNFRDDAPVLISDRPVRRQDRHPPVIRHRRKSALPVQGRRHGGRLRQGHIGNRRQQIINLVTDARSQHDGTGLAQSGPVPEQGPQRLLIRQDKNHPHHPVRARHSRCRQDCRILMR